MLVRFQIVKISDQEMIEHENLESKGLPVPDYTSQDSLVPFVCDMTTVKDWHETTVMLNDEPMTAVVARIGPNMFTPALLCDEETFSKVYLKAFPDKEIINVYDE